MIFFSFLATYVPA